MYLVQKKTAKKWREEDKLEIKKKTKSSLIKKITRLNMS